MPASLIRGELDWQLGPIALETTGDRTLSGVFSPTITETNNGVATVEASEDVSAPRKLVLALKQPAASDSAEVLYSMRDILAADSQNDAETSADNFYCVTRCVFRGQSDSLVSGDRLAFYRLNNASGSNMATWGLQWNGSAWVLFFRLATTGQSGPTAFGTTPLVTDEFFDVKTVWVRGVGAYLYVRKEGETEWSLEVSRVNSDTTDRVNNMAFLIDDVAGTFSGTFNAGVEFHHAVWSTISEADAERDFIDQKMGLVFASNTDGKLTFQLTQNPDAYSNTSGTSLSYFRVNYGTTESLGTTTAWTLLPAVGDQHTARVDVTGLPGDTLHYYRFELRSTGSGAAMFTGDTRSVLTPPYAASSTRPRIWMGSCLDGAGQVSYKPQLQHGLDILDTTPHHLGIFVDDVWYGWGMNALDDDKFTPESENEKFVRAWEAWQNPYTCRLWHKLPMLAQYGDHDAYWNDADLTDRERATGNLDDIAGLLYVDSSSTITPAQVAANGRAVWDSLVGTAMRANFHESGVDYGTGVYGGVRIILTDSWGFRRESTNTGWGATQVAWFKGVVDTADEPLVLCVDASVWGRIGAQGSSLIRIAATEHQDIIDYVEANALTRYVGIAGDSHIGPTAHRRIALSGGDAVASQGKAAGWCGFFIVSPLDQKNNAALNTGTNEATYATSSGSTLREGVDAAYLYREDGFGKPATDPVGGASLDSERGQIRTSGCFFSISGSGVRMTAYGNADNALLANAAYYSTGGGLLRRMHSRLQRVRPV